MGNIEKFLKNTFSAKTKFLHLFLSMVSFTILFLFLLFIFLSLCGIAANALYSYPSCCNWLSVFLLIIPLIVSIGAGIFLIVKNYKKGDFSNTKSYTISIVFVVLFYGAIAILASQMHC